MKFIWFLMIYAHTMTQAKSFAVQKKIKPAMSVVLDSEFETNNKKSSYITETAENTTHPQETKPNFRNGKDPDDKKLKTIADLKIPINGRIDLDDKDSHSDAILKQIESKLSKADKSGENLDKWREDKEPEYKSGEMDNIEAELEERVQASEVLANPSFEHDQDKSRSHEKKGEKLDEDNDKFEADKAEVLDEENKKLKKEYESLKKQFEGSESVKKDTNNDENDNDDDSIKETTTIVATIKSKRIKEGEKDKDKEPTRGTVKSRPSSSEDHTKESKPGRPSSNEDPTKETSKTGGFGPEKPSSDENPTKASKTGGFGREKPSSDEDPTRENSKPPIFKARKPSKPIETREPSKPDKPTNFEDPTKESKPDKPTNYEDPTRETSKPDPPTNQEDPTKESKPDKPINYEDPTRESAVEKKTITIAKMLKSAEKSDEDSHDLPFMKELAKIKWTESGQIEESREMMRAHDDGNKGVEDERYDELNFHLEGTNLHEAQI